MLKKAASTAAPKAKAAPKKMTQTTLKPKATMAKKRKQASDEENSDGEPSSVDVDDSLLSNTPPSAKRQKKAPAPKKAAGKPLQPIDNESFGLDEKDDSAKMKPAKAATDQYQKVWALSTKNIVQRYPANGGDSLPN